MEITLDALQPGKLAVVTCLKGEKAFQKRFIAYGLKPGTIVSCCCCSPDGRTIELQLRGVALTFRTKDLRRIYGCGI